MTATLLRHAGGRPYYKADMDFMDDPALALHYEFTDACRNLNYREMMAIARTVNVCYTTVLNWKQSNTFPGFDIATRVIQWVKSGKPMIKVQPGTETGTHHLGSMF